MTKLSYLLVLGVLTITGCNGSLSTGSQSSSHIDNQNGQGVIDPTPPSPTKSAENQTQIYENRYQLNSLTQKLVNNTGDGYEPLYGVRNFRVVLRGVLYRGGANNVYNKYNKRDNQNPLQDAALKNICEEGFKSAIYLYPTNFSSASRSASCTDFTNKNNNLNYQQITGLDDKNTDKFLEMFYKAIKGQIASPIYIHCWNGWHSSGYVSTLALQQFCGFNADQAVQYWIANTDGNSSGYDAIKTRIRNFQPRSQWQITEAEKRELCLTN